MDNVRATHFCTEPHLEWTHSECLQVFLAFECHQLDHIPSTVTFSLSLWDPNSNILYANLTSLCANAVVLQIFFHNRPIGLLCDAHFILFCAVILAPHRKWTVSTYDLLCHCRVIQSIASARTLMEQLTMSQHRNKSCARQSSTNSQGSVPMGGVWMEENCVLTLLSF